MIRAAFFFLFLISIGLIGCTQNSNPSASMKTIQGYAFGSEYQLKYSGSLDSLILKKQVDQFLRDFDQEFSTYRPDSTISNFNDLKPNQKLKASVRFLEMLKLAKSLQQETGGAFDPSTGKSIQLWGFGGSDRKKIPTRAEIEKAKTGMNSLHWDEATSEAWKTATIQLDLNAFAPGWAADLLGQLLLKNQISNFMINISGEILFHGHRPDGSAWIGGIETPKSESNQDVHLAFRITNLALATSGNYRQFQTLGGKKRSHIIDPVTKHPIDNGISSASVIADSAVRADAWSTAMMVKGEKGLADAEKAGVKAYLIKSQNNGIFETLMNPSMKSYLELNRN